MPRPMSWAYVTAFLEADGAICLENSRSRIRVRLKWVQNADDSFVLYGIQEFLEAHGVTANFYQRISRNGDMFKRNADQCYLEVGKQKDVIFLLRKMLPYMWVKDERAREALKVVQGQVKRNRGKEWLYERSR